MTTRSPDRPSRRKFPMIALALALGAPACKDDKPKEGEATKTEGEAGTKTEEKVDGDPKEGGIGEVAKDATDATAADSMTATGPMTRGSVLAHVMFPDPAALLGKIKRQAAPEAAGAFLEPEFIKMMASGQLGPRGEVVKNIELDKPVACVLVDSTASAAPVACTVGYTGGVDKLVTHMGEDGKQADAGGAKAHYLIEGQHLYVDALGDRVVFGTDPDALTKGKPYLEKNIINRADKNISDVEVVGYVSALMTRYEKELQPIIDSMGKPPLPSTENPMQQGLTEYMLGTNKDMVAKFKEMEQATFAFGFNAEGFTARWAVFPAKGSEFEKELQAVSAGPVDLGFVEKLPDHSAMVVGMRFDGKIGEVKSLRALRDLVVTEYAKELGKDATTVNAALDAFFAEETLLYGEDIAAALTYEPGTLGGLLLEVPLEGGKSGRDGWKAWSEKFVAADVLGPEASKKITWSFKADAATIGGAPVDRWTIELTPEALAEIEKESPTELKAFRDKWKSLAVTIDRAEVEGRTVFVITPTEGDKYMQAAIDAVGGKSALAEDSGYKTVASKNAAVSALYAIDIKQSADFVRQLLPPEESAKIPSPLGNDLSDAFFSSSYGRAGTQTGELNVSQAFIDQARALAN